MRQLAKQFPLLSRLIFFRPTRKSWIGLVQYFTAQRTRPTRPVLSYHYHSDPVLSSPIPAVRMAGPAIECFAPGHPYEGCSACIPLLPNAICSYTDCEVCLPCFGEDEITCTFGALPDLEGCFVPGHPHEKCSECVIFLPSDICNWPECKPCLPCFGEDEVSCTFADDRFSESDPCIECNVCAGLLPDRVCNYTFGLNDWFCERCFTNSCLGVDEVICTPEFDLEDCSNPRHATGTECRNACSPYLPEDICQYPRCEPCAPCFEEDEITCTFSDSEDHYSATLHDLHVEVYPSTTEVCYARNEGAEGEFRHSTPLHFAARESTIYLFFLSLV